MATNRQTLRTLLTFAGVIAACPSVVLAQAWLPPKGEATIAFGYQHIYAHDHLFSRGQRAFRGEMRWNYALSDLNYGITDRFAVRVGLPYVVSKYDGANPHRPPGRPGIDNGRWNGTFQDFHLEARFMATTGSLVVTPFVSGGLPSSDYETHAHSAAGRGIGEIGAGVNLGRRLDPVLPEAYAQTRLAFTVAERVLDISHNRSNANVELGYFVTSALTARALGAWQVTHGGFRIPEDAPPGTIQFLNHDPLARENFFNLGFGLGYAATGSLDLFATAFKTISGKNGVAAKSISFGVAYSFSPAQIIRKKRVSPRLRPEPM